MNASPEHQKSTANPEEITSAINAAYAEFLSAEPTTTTATLLLHHQHNNNSTILPSETLNHDNDSSGNSRPPTPYAISTQIHNGIFFRIKIKIQ